MIKNITNIGGYQFIVIDNVRSMHEQVQAICNKTHLRGTVFISPEGINLSLAGSNIDTQFILDELNSKCGFNNLLIHTTYSDTIPFKRLLVKIRSELVATQSNTTQNRNISYISSEKLKEWLDSKKEFTLLDLRNGFEYSLGTFDRAQHFNLKKFRELENSREEIEKLSKNKPVVTFCTGGIRCEKGALFIEQYNFNKVYQLKGGILDYLLKFHGEHWHGNCFVFDDRISVDKDLIPTYLKLCQSCQTVLQNSEENFCFSCSVLT